MFVKLDVEVTCPLVVLETVIIISLTGLVGSTSADSISGSGGSSGTSS